MEITGETILEFEKIEKTYCPVGSCRGHAITKMRIRIECPSVGTIFGWVNLCAEHAQMAFAAHFPIATPEPEKEAVNEIA